MCCIFSADFYVVNSLFLTGFIRKKKTVHKTTTTDDKRLQNTLKRLGVTPIPGIDEVNIFKDDSVIHFVNPKGKFSITHVTLPFPETYNSQFQFKPLLVPTHGL